MTQKYKMKNKTGSGNWQIEGKASFKINKMPLIAPNSPMFFFLSWRSGNFVQMICNHLCKVVEDLQDRKNCIP